MWQLEILVREWDGSKFALVWDVVYKAHGRGAILRYYGNKYAGSGIEYRITKTE